LTIFSTYSKAIFVTSIGLTVVLMWVLGTEVDKYEHKQLANFIVESQSCLTESTTNNDNFIAYVTDQYVAALVLDMLCFNTVVNRQFGKVEVRWSQRDQDIIQYIGKGIAHLALVKENMMNAFATQQTHGYQVLGVYQNYSAYLISLKEKPLNDKQYLWGKTLGLLDHPSSRSGHIIPKKMLKDLGLLSDQGIQITYANTHKELRSLLASGKVDVISSFWQEEDKLIFSKNYITRLQDNVSGSKWYLKMDTHNTDLACSIQGMLLQLSAQMDSEYYHQITISEQCQSTSVGG
jgi:ABC-type phosphate/phosphonate transport system substrate-binding protein